MDPPLLPSRKRFVPFLVICVAVLPVSAQTIRGRVTDASTGEPLQRAEIRAGAQVARTATDGRYELNLLPSEISSDVLLKATLVGYRPLSQSIRFSSSSLEVDFALHPDTLRSSQSVTVAAGPFDSVAHAGLDLAGSELRNLASVLADDPLRAIQSLPGVGAYSDFQSQFTVRGGSYERTGIYLDGVLLHQPFHSVQGEDANASLTMLQGEMLESAALETGPLAPRYADRGAGAVDFRSRDGDSQRIHARATASASNAGVSAEGPIGKRLAWIAGARKSYLQYIIDRSSDEPGLAFAFWDVQGKLTAQVNRWNQLSVSMLKAHSGLDRTKRANLLGLNALMLSGYDSGLVIGAWRVTAGKAMLAQRGAFLTERYDNTNRNNDPLVNGRYQERVWNGDGALNWSPSVVTEGGWSVRRVSDDGRANQILNPPATARIVEQYKGSATRAGAYAQQTWSPGAGVDLRFGGRLDAHSLASGGMAASPYAAVAFPAFKRTRLSLGWGRNAQFAELRQLLSPVRVALPPERATHFQAAVDVTTSERSRLRIELFERRDRDLLFRPRWEPRLDNAGRIIAPLLPAPWVNSLNGRARGWQAMWQRRSANGLNGWVAYTYTGTRYDERVSGRRFVSDFELTHQFQTFLSYRVRPTVNLSGRYVHATGLPLRGYFERRGAEYFLTQQRNLLRLPDYQRWDTRINKAYVRKRFQATLFAEVINLTNRRNLAIDDLTGYDARTGRARVLLTRTFPILPSAGVVFDF